MKKIPSILLALLVSFLFCGCKTNTSAVESVNLVIGDIGYVTKYHAHPNDCTSDKARIVSHFDFVIEELKRADLSHLSEEKQVSRAQLIAYLEHYRDRGQFPKNKSNSGKRLPCFIDDEGTICAVGYLVEKTAGRQLAEDINEKHQYEYISEMNDEIVDNWIANSGLTERECAMIQPTYDNWYRPKHKFQLLPMLAIGNRLENTTSGFVGFTVSRGYGKKFSSKHIALRSFVEFAGKDHYRFHTSVENFFGFSKSIFNPSLGIGAEYFPQAATVWRLRANLLSFWAFKYKFSFQLNYAYAILGAPTVNLFSSPHLLTLNIGLHYNKWRKKTL
jgi:hypothetical protein